MEKREWEERRRAMYLEAGWTKGEANRVAYAECAKAGGVGRVAGWTEESLETPLREKLWRSVRGGKVGLEELIPGCAVPGAGVGDEVLRPEYFLRAVVWAAQMVCVEAEKRVAPPNLLALTLLKYAMEPAGFKDLMGMLPKVYPNKGEGAEGRTYETDYGVELTGLGRVGPVEGQVADGE